MISLKSQISAVLNCNFYLSEEIISLLLLSIHLNALFFRNIRPAQGNGKQTNKRFLHEPEHNTTDFNSDGMLSINLRTLTLCI